MQLRFVFILLLLVLSGCAFGAPDQTSAPVSQAGTPEAGGTPSGNRGPRGNVTPPPNFTPGAGRTPAAGRNQQTPAANATPSNATPAPTRAVPTAVVVTVITQTSGVPTAVPIPQVIIPTALPASPDNSGQPAPTAVSGANTSRNVPLPTPLPLPSVSSSAPSAADLAALRGKIVFFSDRSGYYPQLFVMNADGSNQHLCNCSDALQTLVNNELTSPDKKQFLFVKQAGGARNPDFQIWSHNNETSEDKFVTGGPPGFPTVDYDPAWSPDSRFVAWVTEANGFDEIYLHNVSNNDDTRLTESHGEWYKHPGFSPDGSHIAYWTNLSDVNHKQIWLMNLDGSGAQNISNNQFSDWDPIWVK